MIKRLLLLPLIIWLTGCVSQYSISEQQVQQYLNKKVVKQIKLDNDGMKIESGIKRLDVKLGEQPDRISVTAYGELKVDTPLFPLYASMEAKFNAKPRYDMQSHGLYLDDLQVEDVSLTPAKLQSLIGPVARQMANQAKGLLKEQPIYVLDSSKPKEAQIAELTESIKVEKGKLTLIFK